MVSQENLVLSKTYRGFLRVGKTQVLGDMTWDGNFFVGLVSNNCPPRVNIDTIVPYYDPLLNMYFEPQMEI